MKICHSKLNFFIATVILNCNLIIIKDLDLFERHCLKHNSGTKLSS